MNNHFLTRAFTTHLEFGQRQLWYYSFSKNKIDRQSSRSLLARENIYDDSTELKLNQLIENPIITYVHQLSNNNHAVFNKTAELALQWVPLIQSMRLPEMQNQLLPPANIPEKTVSDLLKKSLEFIEQGCNCPLSQKTYVLKHNNSLVFSNDFGTFPVTYFSKNYMMYKVALALPVSKEILLIWSDTSPSDWLYVHERHYTFLSVGLTNDIVIIPPYLKGNYDDNTLISILRGSRENYKNYIDIQVGINEISQKFFRREITESQVTSAMNILKEKIEKLS